MRSLVPAAVAALVAAHAAHAQPAADSAAIDAPTGAPGNASAAAQPRAPNVGRRPLDLAVAVRAGTLGYGLEVGKLVTGHLGVRVGGTLLNYGRTQALDDVRYDASLRLRNASAMVDLFPSNRGAFRLTAGVVRGTTEIAGSGLAEGTTFRINGTSYEAAQVGTLSGAVRFPKTRPYVGIGWGSPARSRGGWGITSDFGVAVGRPTAVLNATGAANDPQLRADLAEQRDKAQDQLDRYARFYPVMNWGVVRRF